MLNEVLHDIAKRVFYFTPRFNENGRKIYVSLMKEAIATGGEDTLQAGLQEGDNFNKYEAQGKKVSNNVAVNFAQQEFNKYYIRAVCVKAIEMNERDVEVYRAHPLTVKKHKSDLRIGAKINADRLLKELRSSIGVPSTVFPELVSGLSVRLKVPVDAVEEPMEADTEAAEQD